MTSTKKFNCPVAPKSQGQGAYNFDPIPNVGERLDRPGASSVRKKVVDFF